MKTYPGNATTVEADVNVAQVAGQTATVGAGAVAAGTPRVTLASDDPGVAKLTIVAGAGATGPIKSGGDVAANNDKGVGLMARRSAAANIPADGQWGHVLMDGGRVHMRMDGLASNATSTAYEASKVVKASAGTLFGFSGYNSGAAQFILFYNSTTVPADAAQAVLVLKVAATASFAADFGVYGRAFTTGISWSNSSTSPLKTVGAADCFLDAQYT